MARLNYDAQGYRGCAIGKGRQLAKTEIEKLKLDQLSCREAINEAARMYASHFSLQCQAN